MKRRLLCSPAMVRRMNDHEGLFEGLIEAVTSGMTATEYAKDVGVLYSDLMIWVRNDPSKVDMLDAAKLDRDEWAMESLYNQLRAIATAATHTAFNENNELKPPSDWSPDLSAQISKMKVSSRVEYCSECSAKVPIKVFEVIFHDKLKAVKMLGDRIKPPEKKEQSISLGVLVTNIANEARKTRVHDVDAEVIDVEEEPPVRAEPVKELSASSVEPDPEPPKPGDPI